MTSSRNWWFHLSHMMTRLQNTESFEGFQPKLGDSTAFIEPRTPLRLCQQISAAVPTARAANTLLFGRSEMILCHSTANHTPILVWNTGHPCVCCTRNVLCIQVHAHIWQLSPLILEDGACVARLDRIIRDAAEVDISPRSALDGVARAGFHSDHTSRTTISWKRNVCFAFAF